MGKPYRECPRPFRVMQADAHIVPPLQFHNPADSVHVRGRDRPAFQDSGDKKSATNKEG